MFCTCYTGTVVNAAIIFAVLGYGWEIRWALIVAASCR